MAIIFQIFACVVLQIFYGIYFGKLFAQKKRGIRTHQIGTRKEKSIRIVETFMSVATVGIVPVHLQILEEEKYLKNTFGEPYLNYKKQVLRYFGRH